MLTKPLCQLHGLSQKAAKVRSHLTILDLRWLEQQHGIPIPQHKQRHCLLSCEGGENGTMDVPGLASLQSLQAQRMLGTKRFEIDCMVNLQSSLHQCVDARNVSAPRVVGKPLFANSNHLRAFKLLPRCTKGTPLGAQCSLSTILSSNCLVKEPDVKPIYGFYMQTLWDEVGRTSL